MSIDRAIDMLKDRYQAACENPNVHDPVSYALYAVWEQSDREFGQLYAPEIEKEEGILWFE